ncbi:MAG TPA: hypothetical protein VNZ22_11350 [Bacillota bacterium]|nr:hypothetical protein [Bacillota bacterium]
MACLLFAAHYYYRMVTIGWIQGRGKTIMEDGIEFFYFGLLYVCPLALLALVAALFAGPARKNCVILSVAYPALFILYLVLNECFF